MISAAPFYFKKFVTFILFTLFFSLCALGGHNPRHLAPNQDGDQNNEKATSNINDQCSRQLTEAHWTPSKPDSSYMVWVDLETTGLDHHQDHILEIAVIITDNELNELGRFHRVIKNAQQHLNQMDDRVVEMHTKSGLLAEIKASVVTVETVEDELLQFLNTFPELIQNESILNKDGVEIAKKPKPCLSFAGSSIGFDRGFMKFHMERIAPYIHHRITDVSSIRLEMQRLLGARLNTQYPHRAMADIESTLLELRTYRAVMRRGLNNILIGL